MCKCKIHWSVVSIIVSAVAVTLFTAAVATPNWAHASLPKYDVNSGLFLSCQNLNNTCSYTHVQFHGEKEKSGIIASAVLNMCACIGMWFFFILSVLSLCGLFDDDSLVTVAVIISYASGLVAMIGTATFAINMSSMGFSLRWSFLLAVVGLLINVLAGILMCVGRNVSVSRKKSRAFGSRAKSREPTEEVQMREMGRENIWATGGGD